MRLAAVFGIAFLLIPTVAAQGQPSTGHVTVEVVPDRLHLDVPGSYAFQLWINMTIQCDAGSGGYAFPRMDAVPDEDPAGNWNVDPTSFVADGPFIESSGTISHPSTYTYVYERALKVNFLGEAEENGTTNVIWDTHTGVQAVATVPPSCTREGFRWVVDRSDVLEVSHVGHAFQRNDPGREAISRLEGASPLPPEPDATDPVMFQGRGRLPEEALTLFAGIVLGVVAFIGLFARRL